MKLAVLMLIMEYHIKIIFCLLGQMVMRLILFLMSHVIYIVFNLTVRLLSLKVSLILSILFCINIVMQFQ